MDYKEKQINEYLKNRYAYIKAYENANVYLSSEGKETIPLKNINPKNVKYRGIEEINPQVLQQYDLVVIATAHKSYNLEMIQKNSKMIFDTRNAMKSVVDKSNIDLL